MSVVGAVVGFVAVLLWLALVATIATMNESDAAGNGLSYSFAFILAVPLWMLLAAAMFMAASRSDIPGWVKVAAVLLVPLSLAATFATISLLANRGSSAGGWPIVVPALIPPLILGYAVWSMNPSVRAALPFPGLTRVIWATVLALTLVPWPLLPTRLKRDAISQADREAAGMAMEDVQRRELEDVLRSLTAETPLSRWLVFATAGNDLRERTLEGIRALPNRQREAESMRGPDQAMLMSELRNLGLVASPGLCDASTHFLAEHAESFRARAASTARYEIEGSAIERYLFAMQWLASNGCDLTRAIDAYDGVVRLYPNAPDRARFLARLAALRVTAR